MRQLRGRRAALATLPFLALELAWLADGGSGTDDVGVLPEVMTAVLGLLAML